MLVSQQNASRFEDVEASPLSLDLDDEQWLGFAINYAEEQELLRTFFQRPGPALSATPRLSNRGGVRMPMARATSPPDLVCPCWAFLRRLRQRWYS